MICQETANYKEERIVVENLIYIIFIISYTILLLDFITLSHVQFLKFHFNFNYIHISHLSSYSLYISISYICFVHLFSMHLSLFSLLSHLIVFTMYIFII